MTKAIKVAAVSFIFLLLAAWIAGPALLSGAPAGSESNPLISLDYLQKVVSALKGEVSQEITGLQDQVANLQQRLNELETNPPQQPPQDPPTQPEPPQDPDTGSDPNDPTPPPVPEPQYHPLTILVNASAVNFRPQPDTNSIPITLVRLGDLIRINQWQDGWYHGSLPDGRTGWIFAEFTLPEQNHTPGRIKFALVNVRTGPGTNFDRLADRLHENHMVNIIGIHKDWYQVVLADGQQGWILSSLVEKMK